MPAIERHIQVGYRLRVFFSEDVFNPRNPLLKEVLNDDQSPPDSARREPLHEPGRPPTPSLSPGVGESVRRTGEEVVPGEDEPFCESPSSATPKKVLIVIDESLAQSQPELAGRIEHYFDAKAGRLKLVRPPLIIEGGESTKNSEFHVSEIYSQIEQHHIDRHAYIIAVGGGALLDMAGLAAATAHRGVRHVRIPSTTLSQADSGVGVKNGINRFGKKNFVGTFAPPFAVINDFQLLASLSPSDKRAGFVEAVKVALIRDREFFEWIEREAAALAAFDPVAMRSLIRRCAELHLDHIATSGDPFELGAARPLDFGHWSAHKLEQLSKYRIRHGEAVAVGIALDSIYAREMNHLSSEATERVLGLLERIGFELFANELLHLGATNTPLLLEGLEEFREHLGGELSITLLEDIGRSFEVHQMESSRIMEAIHELRRRHEGREE